MHGMQSARGRFHVYYVHALLGAQHYLLPFILTRGGGSRGWRLPPPSPSSRTRHSLPALRTHRTLAFWVCLWALTGVSKQDRVLI